MNMNHKNKNKKQPGKKTATSSVITSAVICAQYMDKPNDVDNSGNNNDNGFIVIFRAACVFFFQKNVLLLVLFALWRFFFIFKANLQPDYKNYKKNDLERKWTTEVTRCISMVHRLFREARKWACCQASDLKVKHSNCLKYRERDQHTCYVWDEPCSIASSSWIAWRQQCIMIGLLNFHLSQFFATLSRASHGAQVSLWATFLLNAVITMHAA